MVAKIAHDADERRHDNLEPRSQTLRARQFACTLNFRIFERIDATVKISRPAIICVEALIYRREAIANTLIEADEQISGFEGKGISHLATASTIAVSIAAVEAERPTRTNHVSATDFTVGTSHTILA